MTTAAVTEGAGMKAFSEGNSLFVDELYEQALERYSEAIGVEPSQPSYYLKRSAVHIKLNDFQAALEDANRCLELEPSNAQAHFRRGIALFSKEEFRMARESFATAKDLGVKSCDTWLNKCDIEVADLPAEQAVASASSETVTTPEEPEAPQISSNPLTLAEKARDSFYQSNQAVTFTIFGKNLKPEDVAIKFSEQSVDIEAKFPDSSILHRTLQLWGCIVPSSSSYTLNKFKICITLQKKDNIDWVSLEQISEPAKHNVRANERSDVVPGYPSSSKKKHDWSSIERGVLEAEEKEEPQGDAALNKLFQQIYSNADPDTKRAMMKSYQTSGGTVLSTNWSEVKEKNYEKTIEAPQGMEVRKW